MKKRVTIKDIAREAGVSANCVSRVFMDAPDISAKTKARIRAKAEEMGYVHDRNASALRSGRSGVIAVVFDNLLNPYYYIMLNYLWAALNEKGYRIVTFKNLSLSIGEDTAKEIISVKAEGVLSFLTPTAGAQKLLNAYSVPLVVVGRTTHGMCDCISLDDRAGGRLAARDFISRGFRKPLYLGETRELDCVVERAEGFAEEFEAAGMSCDVRFLYGAEAFKFANMYRSLVGTENEPDCVFCFNDFAAYEILSAIDRSGDDFPIIGFDDIGHELCFPGKLATIGYDKQDIARRALDMLLYRMNGGQGDPRETVITEMTLVSPAR